MQLDWRGAHLASHSPRFECSIPCSRISSDSSEWSFCPRSSSTGTSFYLLKKGSHPSVFWSTLDLLETQYGNLSFSRVYQAGHQGSPLPPPLITSPTKHYQPHSSFLPTRRLPRNFHTRSLEPRYSHRPHPDHRQLHHLWTQLNMAYKEWAAPHAEAALLYPGSVKDVYRRGD